MTSAAPPPPCLTVRDLGFNYPGRSLFAGWSHDFRAGLTWVRGHNGCGKSTLLRLLGGAVKPTAGTLRIANTDVQEQPLAYRQEVYWCAPDGIAFDHLKPPEYFGFIAGLYPRFDADAVGPLVEALGLRPFLDRRISQLSTGTQRKVAVISAMAAGTPAVLLDEPLAAMDQTSVSLLRGHFATAAMQRNRVWIITSHEPLGEQAEAHGQILDLPTQS